jgi:aryl-alcohol dehydrogenase-like predicted oxidoreductase
VRYRPLGQAGGIVSAVSVRLEPDPARRRRVDWYGLIAAALDCGISGFLIEGLDDALAQVLAKAFAAVDRRLLFVGWRCGQAPDPPHALADTIRSALDRTGLGWLDAALVEEDAGEGPPEALQALKAEGLVRRIGLRAGADALEACLGRGGPELVATPYGLASGWRERRLLREASEAGMAVFATSSYPRSVRTLAEAAGKIVPTRKNPLAGVGAYGFLHRTHGWTGEEIALAYALCEPALASVLVRPSSTQHLERLAEVVDRDLPPGLAAQIEMARFSPDAQGADLRRA